MVSPVVGLNWRLVRAIILPSSICLPFYHHQSITALKLVPDFWLILENGWMDGKLYFIKWIANGMEEEKMIDLIGKQLLKLPTTCRLLLPVHWSISPSQKSFLADGDRRVDRVLENLPVLDDKLVYTYLTRKSWVTISTHDRDSDRCIPVRQTVHLEQNHGGLIRWLVQTADERSVCNARCLSRTIL